MRRLRLLPALAAGTIVLLAAVPVATASAASIPPPEGVPGHWALVANYYGPAMAKWQHTLSGGQCATAGKIRVTRARSVALTTSGKAGSCAEIDSRRTFGPGEVIEARVRFDVTRHGQIVNQPAFWMTAASGEWPGGGEIGVAEGRPGRGVCTSYRYPSGGGVASAPSRCQHAPIAAGWHVYAVDWQHGKLRFYYDGKLFMTDTGSYVNGKPQSIIFTNMAAPSGQGASTMQVRWTRVYKTKK